MALGAGAAVAITQLLLDAVDAVSAGVLQVTTGDTVQQMGNSILAPGSISGATSNPAGLILISLLALVAVVVVWFALTIRKLLIIVAAVLSPFAFAGSLADFSRSWVRRWVELIIALVFSKLILIFIFVIGLDVLLKGVGSTGSSGAQGITQTVTGILILALAGSGPLGGNQDGPLRRRPPGGDAHDGRARHRGGGRGAVDGPACRCRRHARRHGRCRCWHGVGERKAVVTSDSCQRPSRRHARRHRNCFCGRTVCPVECRCRSGLIRIGDSIIERERPVLERVDPRSHCGDHLCSRNNRVGG